jgi:hypothetical protein
VFDELETEALAIRESFKNAEFRQISQEELEELELRRLEEVKREGRETANRVGFHAVRDARTQ